VRMYYALTNFYQNHRLYVKSRDDTQLLGDLGTANDPKRPKKDCEPLHESNINICMVMKTLIFAVLV